MSDITTTANNAFSGGATYYYPGINSSANQFGSVTVGTTASISWCQPCGAFWYPSWGVHSCNHGVSAHEHDYEQARAPFESTLYCRKCGETVKLRRPLPREGDPK